MPYISKHQRARGGWLDPEVTKALYVDPDGHYKPEDLGARCVTCGLPMVAALEPEGFDTHPACPDPEPEKPKRRRRRA